VSGGFKFDLSLGDYYVPNITPDSVTGIGRYTDGEIARVLRNGVRPNGTAAFDFMPFHDMTNEDMTAVISYLRSQKPVRNKLPENTVTLMDRVINAFLIKPVGPGNLCSNPSPAILLPNMENTWLTMWPIVMVAIRTAI
jgi:hypothetical protein